VTCLKAYYMYGLLDYQHWNIYCDDRWIVMVIINTADRSVNFHPGDGQPEEYGITLTPSYKHWTRWLVDHDGGDHPRAKPPSKSTLTGDAG
jgi:hypothetical protein